MHTFQGLSEVNPGEFETPVLTIGVFDGVHRGHQKILSELNAWAKEVRGDSVVLTFDCHPRAIVTGEPPPCITSLEHRLVLFERFGVQKCIVLLFDQEIMNMDAEAFLRKVVIGKVGARRLVLGEDSHFGKDRSGNLALIARVGDEYGLSRRGVELVSWQGRIMSSTAIRQAVAEGRLEEASVMLGRTYSVLGDVVKGAGRGVELGYPTANLDLHHELRPPRGVYGARVVIDGMPRSALVNIGSRPTFYPELPACREGAVEVHVLDFEGSLYGHVLEVSFLFKIRDERKFSGPAALIKQIRCDEEVLRTRLREQEREKGAVGTGAPGKGAADAGAVGTGAADAGAAG
jgi:riboflavin kinase/FMN adenylyltransferase